MIARPPTIYIDPGVKYFGFCWAAGGEMYGAGKRPRQDINTFPECVQRCVMEEPWGVGQSTTEQDIMQLCLAAGEYAGHFPERKYLRPYQAPKPIRHARALEALTKLELARLPPQKTHRQHALCAVYMFLRDVGRIVA